MRDLDFTLQRWAAWAPGLETEQDWNCWAQTGQSVSDDGSSPKLDFVEPMLRRRFSRLTRMALQAARRCLDAAQVPSDSVRTVFCSRHGEIHRTKTLLDDIVRGELVSPMGFSLSVHNTASGLFSIASHNTAPSTAIAAGIDTLEMAVVDALGHLQRHPGQPVLVVLADEPLPAFYQPYDQEHMVPHGLALLLGNGGDGEALRLSAVADGAAAVRGEAHGIALLRWLNGGAEALCLGGERLNWQWSRRHG